jgi:hypothetical protein
MTKMLQVSPAHKCTKHHALILYVYVYFFPQKNKAWVLVNLQVIIIITLGKAEAAS